MTSLGKNCHFARKISVCNEDNAIKTCHCGLRLFSTDSKFRSPTILILSSVRGCLHDTGVDFRPGASSLQFPLMALYLFTWYHHKMSRQRQSPRRDMYLYRGKNFTPVRNLATVSSKRETPTCFGVKLFCR